MTSRRASLLLCSVAVHVLGLALLILLSAVAPGLLPKPVQHIVVDLRAAPKVRLADIPLPRRPASPRDSTQSPATSVTTNPDLRNLAPPVAPVGVSPEHERAGGIPG